MNLAGYAAIVALGVALPYRRRVSYRKISKIFKTPGKANTRFPIYGKKGKENFPDFAGNNEIEANYVLGGGCLGSKEAVPIYCNQF